MSKAPETVTQRLQRSGPNETRNAFVFEHNNMLVRVGFEYDSGFSPFEFDLERKEYPRPFALDTFTGKLFGPHRILRVPLDLNAEDPEENANDAAREAGFTDEEIDDADVDDNTRIYRQLTVLKQGLPRIWDTRDHYGPERYLICASIIEEIESIQAATPEPNPAEAEPFLRDLVEEYTRTVDWLNNKWCFEVLGVRAYTLDGEPAGPVDYVGGIESDCNDKELKEIVLETLSIWPRYDDLTTWDDAALNRKGNRIADQIKGMDRRSVAYLTSNADLTAIIEEVGRRNAVR